MKSSLSKYTESMAILLVIVLLFLTSACGAADRGRMPPSGAEQETTSSAETSSPSSRKPVLSLEQFEKEVARENLGIVNKINGNEGYDAALVTAEDGTNYIYMSLPDAAMAQSVLTDSDGDGRMDADLTLVQEKDGYRLYTQETDAEGSAEYAMYGHCLLSGSLILVVNGALDRKQEIRKQADHFMEALGFHVT